MEIEQENNYTRIHYLEREIIAFDKFDLDLSVFFPFLEQLTLETFMIFLG